MWLCPFKVDNDPGQLKVKGDQPKMFVDIGVYGVPKAKGYETVGIRRCPGRRRRSPLCTYLLVGLEFIE